MAKRAECVYYCGSVCYWQEDIDEALEQGYGYYKSGSAPSTYKMTLITTDIEDTLSDSRHLYQVVTLTSTTTTRPSAFPPRRPGTSSPSCPATSRTPAARLERTVSSSTPRATSTPSSLTLVPLATPSSPAARRKLVDTTKPSFWVITTAAAIDFGKAFLWRDLSLVYLLQ